MARGDNDKKETPSAEKKESFHDEDRTIRRKIDEFNSWLARMEAMDEEELNEYAKQNKHTLCSQQKAAMKKLLQKNKRRKKKKRTALSPILGAVMKFHKDDDDDDVDPPADDIAA